MLTKFDELTCHQDVSTFDHPSTSDRAWTEKLWCNIHDTAGELVLATGLGVYPNRNVLDGYACLRLARGSQTNVRLSRELRPRIDELALGPLSWEVVEPFRRIRLRLADNPQKITFDLEFQGRFEPSEEYPQFGRSRGRMHVNTCRYSQLGRAEGWIEFEGRKFQVTPDSHRAGRDHSWGVRMGVGAPEQGVQMADIATFTSMLINWMTFQFEDWGLACYLIEKADGTVERLTGEVVPPVGSSETPIPIVRLEHDYVYSSGAPRMKSGRVVFHLADGTSRVVEMEELTTMFLRGGGYLGCNDVYHGQWMGPSWQDGETWDVAQDQKADEVHGLNDTVVSCRCDGQVGYGIVENLILPPFERYGR